MRSGVPALALGALFAADAGGFGRRGTTGLWGLAPVIDAVTDDGAGRIRVEWSLAPPPPREVPLAHP